MEMSIDNANKLLSVIISTITEDDDYFTIEDENLKVFKETLLTAIDTMRKYQKIEQIVKNTQQLCSYGNAFIDIREVVEDGDVDIEDFEMSKSCVTCKYHLFDEVYEYFYCLLKKQNIDCSEHSEWESDE